MAKESLKPGNMLYPLPAVLVTCSDGKGKENAFTVAWTGTVCSSPAMVSISVRPERFSHGLIKETGEFVINLTTEDLAFATDYCGVKSGRNEDKIKTLGLKTIPGKETKAPLLVDSPVNLECKVKQIIPLGSHDMFLAEVVAVHVNDEFMDEKRTFHLEDAKPIVYSHGTYLKVGKPIGTFGYSVRKKKKKYRNENKVQQTHKN